MVHGEVTMLVAQERVRDVGRRARQAALLADAARAERRGRAVAQTAQDLVVRLCRVGDDPALERLAVLEGRRLPRGSFVLAEVGGEIAAAVPLDVDEPPLADPFRPTAHLVSVLELRAAQLRPARGGRSLLRRLPRFA